jgi:phenylacetate-CoA ligase
VTKILDSQECRCGRTHPKIARIKGRVDHIIKVADVKLLPSDIEDFIFSTPGLRNEYHMSGGGDKLRLKVEYSPQVSDLDALRTELRSKIEQGLQVRTEIELVPQGTLLQTGFKAEHTTKNDSKEIRCI